MNDKRVALRLLEAFYTEAGAESFIRDRIMYEILVEEMAKLPLPWYVKRLLLWYQRTLGDPREELAHKVDRLYLELKKRATTAEFERVDRRAQAALANYEALKAFHSRKTPG